MSAYAIFDGLPVYARVLDHLRRFHTILVTTAAAADYLAANGLAATGIAPPGVDFRYFQPLDRQALRRRAKLDGGFLIGAFGRNTERKQLHRVLQAMHHLVVGDGETDVCCYFHSARRGYWDLADLANRWGVSAHVLFPDDIRDETDGVPVRRLVPGAPPADSASVSGFGYVERLSLCDVVVNVPHSGDFEQVLIEAPACGVPVLATDDDGIMRDALGPGIPLTASAATLGNTGQDLYYVDPRTIAERLRALRRDDAQMARLRGAGLQHARSHAWATLEREIVRAVDTAPTTGPAANSKED